MSDTNTSGSAPVKKSITRRDVLAMAGCGVAGLVVGGALASWGVTQESIASGRIELRTTPTKMIVTDRARCSGCQRCEMMCTLKNDGRVCQHIARVRVWDNYFWGKSADTREGSFGDGKGACEFTVEHCKQCADPQCVKYCPVHAIYADEKTGARRVDPKKCIGCGMCSQAFPLEHAPRRHRDRRVHEVHLLRPLRRAVPQRRHPVHRLAGCRAEDHRRGHRSHDDRGHRVIVSGRYTPHDANARAASAGCEGRRPYNRDQGKE